MAAFEIPALIIVEIVDPGDGMYHFLFPENLWLGAVLITCKPHKYLICLCSVVPSCLKASTSCTRNLYSLLKHFSGYLLTLYVMSCRCSACIPPFLILFFFSVSTAYIPQLAYRVEEGVGGLLIPLRRSGDVIQQLMVICSALQGMLSSWETSTC